ncbi:histidine phosphatase family protein [Spelaeicoccus albus]|uniref:Putative phosphoglycerate mutase n=1 Tax=Spelaeicoccus albus TaxID=1280376 RepID=A0A7Z0IIV7_9MICO|nr:histidine phosphatase family protein [Spelaeicoccus albus]NYI68900.1 putative phosphoglycerate mutase [Spelaeicoccus albus]
MTAQTVILWRHGQTTFNNTGKFQGHIDTELDDSGRAQVRRSAPVIASARPVRIVTSDLRRATQTAAALAELVHIEPESDSRLRETAYGKWEGLTRAEVQQRWPDELTSWTGGNDDPTHGGESRRSSATRVADAIKEYIASTAGGTLVVVGHGGSLRGAVGQLLELPLSSWDRFAVPQNSYWAVLEQRRQGLTLTQFNLGPGVVAD